MAVYGSPEYQPAWYEKIWTAIAKRAPFYIGRLVQMIMFGIFGTIRFIGQMFRDAIGK
jgi:hypothetical protein